MLPITIHPVIAFSDPILDSAMKKFENVQFNTIEIQRNWYGNSKPGFHAKTTKGSQSRYVFSTSLYIPHFIQHYMSHLITCFHHPNIKNIFQSKSISNLSYKSNSLL